MKGGAGFRVGVRGALALAWSLCVAFAAHGALADEGAAAPVARVQLGAIPEAQPGAEAFPKALRSRLAAALAARGPGYEPRTRQRDASGRPLYSNRLLLEASPYLQQHAHNPVDWHPWGDEAFAKARRLGRPVLVSIGYSTCHWCHVMEDESFDDLETATLLNSAFVAIKVDRELRPDVDSVYMTAIQALGERGGWPLNVFVTPDRKPFYAGTYFPPEDGRGRPSFKRVLASIAEQWASEPERLLTAANQLGDAVRESLAATQPAQSQALDAGVIERAVRDLLSHVDEEWGGVGQGTKFPSSFPTRLWMRAQASAEPELAGAISRLTRLTLDKMASGGMRDQLGGGFHRYSTERRWLVPHFEKMLYDNALLAILYVEAWQWSGEERDAEVARDTLAYLDREMSAPGGGFHSATDADSLAPNGEREEGWFFTWTPAELRAALTADDAKAAIAWWGVSEAGDLDGRSILRTWSSEAEVAASLGRSVGALRAAIARARAALYEVRSKRPSPLLDDKVIAAWNGLAISAFARAGFAFGRDDLRDRAARTAGFVLSRMRDEGGRLKRVFLGERAAESAFLADYSFMIAALLDLFEAGAGPQWLEEAIALQATLDAHYLDAEGGGYFQTAHDAETLLVREKPMTDGAIPSGNSVAAANLLRLAGLTADDQYRERAAALFSAFAPSVARNPSAFGELLLAVDFQRGSSKEIIVVEPEAGDAAGVGAMLAPLRRGFVPSRVLASVTEGDSLERTARVSALVAGKKARGGAVTAYVCEDRVCAFPTSDPADFARQIGLAARADEGVR